MTSTRTGASLPSNRLQPAHQLHHQINQLRQVTVFPNLAYLMLDYLTLGLVLTLATWACRHAPHWTLSLLSGALGVLAVGAIQHRLAGLGHEAAHYSFLPHRFWNDLIADVFCMFPIGASLHHYRHIHLAHHQYVNDWNRDPDLKYIGKSKMMHRFPASPATFVWRYFVSFLWPGRLLRYLWDVLRLSSLGQSDDPNQKPSSNFGSLFLTVLGVAYCFVLAYALWKSNQHHWLAGIFLASLGGWTFSAIIIQLFPRTWFRTHRLKHAYSARTMARLHLLVVTVMLLGLALLKYSTGVNFGGYFLLFWLVPLATSFPYLMLLRDVYQHANADTGRISNTRVFHAPWWARWAVFVYGQDYHTPHHLYPMIPHFRLPALHQLLKDQSPDYNQQVVECGPHHQSFWDEIQHPRTVDSTSVQGNHQAPALDRANIV